MKRYTLAIKRNDLTTTEAVAHKSVNGEYTLASDTLRLLDTLKLAKQHIFDLNTEYDKHSYAIMVHMQNIIDDIEGVVDDE